LKQLPAARRPRRPRLVQMADLRGEADVQRGDAVFWGGAGAGGGGVGGASCRAQV